jgi:hypothetical protein
MEGTGKGRLPPHHLFPYLSEKSYLCELLRTHCSFLSFQENSPEQLPWSYREKTCFGRLGQDLVEELVGCCRRKPFALVCGSPEFTKDVTRYLLCAGLTADSYFLF